MRENHVGNRLLAALPAKEYKRLMPGLKVVPLEYADVIYESGAVMKDVYFPSSGIISLLSSVNRHASLEVGIVGNEGMVGLSSFLGVKTSPNRAVVQGSGEAMRLSAKALKAECALGGQLPVILHRFVHSLMSQISQSAACFRFHPVDRRLSRWLLMTSDRMGTREFQLTQHFLSAMLGVRREAVNKAAAELERRGLIEHTRGRVLITDRKQLVVAACECYAIIRKEELTVGNHSKV